MDVNTYPILELNVLLVSKVPVGFIGNNKWALVQATALVSTGKQAITWSNHNYDHELLPKWDHQAKMSEISNAYIYAQTWV